MRSLFIEPIQQACPDAEIKGQILMVVVIIHFLDIFNLVLILKFLFPSEKYRKKESC
jgi:hypothetical protein